MPFASYYIEGLRCPLLTYESSAFHSMSRAPAFVQYVLRLITLFTGSARETSICVPKVSKRSFFSKRYLQRQLLYPLSYLLWLVSTQLKPFVRRH